MYLCSFRFFLANVKLWVSWKRGPACWIKIAPTLMYFITLLNYILLPLIGIGWFSAHWNKMSTSVYGLYMGCVLFIWLIQMGFYFVIIRPYVYVNAKAYLASRKQSLERKEREELSNSQDVTVDFPNNDDSMDRDLVAGASD